MNCSSSLANSNPSRRAHISVVILLVLLIYLVKPFDPLSINNLQGALPLLQSQVFYTRLCRTFFAHHSIFTNLFIYGFKQNILVM